MSDGYELTDAEKRDLIKLITEGRPLPEKYRFILFQDKREVELVWNGKTREVCTAVLPFQSLEHIDEPREEKEEREQAGLFDLRGRHLMRAFCQPSFASRPSRLMSSPLLALAVARLNSTTSSFWMGFVNSTL